MGQGSCKADDSIVTPGTAAATCSTRPSNPDVGNCSGPSTHNACPVACNPTGCGYTTSGCSVADQVNHCDPGTM